MLSAITRVCGTAAISRRVASMPFSSGIATSITTMSGRSCSASSHRLAAIAGLAHNLHIGLRAQDHLEALAHYRMVVSQQDSNAFHSRMGTRTSIRTPSPGRECTVTSPPALRARARMPIMPEAAAGRRAAPAPDRVRRPESTGRSRRPPMPA